MGVPRETKSSGRTKRSRRRGIEEGEDRVDRGVGGGEMYLRVDPTVGGFDRRSCGGREGRTRSFRL